VISLRGKIVPVCDLATRLGLEGEGRGCRANIVIVETGTTTAGVIVDEVEEVLTVDETQLDAVPGTASDLIKGVAKVGDRLVVLLDPGAIFAGAEVQAAA
jgi:purine-binding chemotaxis protein CheW